MPSSGSGPFHRAPSGSRSPRAAQGKVQPSAMAHGSNPGVDRRVWSTVGEDDPVARKTDTQASSGRGRGGVVGFEEVGMRGFQAYFKNNVEPSRRIPNVGFW